MWPFKKKNNAPAAPVEKRTRWEIEKDTANFIQITVSDNPDIKLLEELLDAGFESVHCEWTFRMDRARFICRKTNAADFSKLRQY